MIFTTKNKVRMHDTDMAGILYFPRQFRFVHDALEDLLEKEGMTFQKIFTEDDFVFVIVHAESDYYASLHVGDPIEVHVYVERLGNTSFTMKYNIYRHGQLTGSARTVHVCLEAQNRTKVPIPQSFRDKFSHYLSDDISENHGKPDPK